MALLEDKLQDPNLVQTENPLSSGEAGSIPIAPVATKPSKAGQSFAGVNEYVEPNKEATGELANKLVTSLNDTAAQARGAVDTLKPQISSQITSITPDANLINKAKTAPETLVGNQFDILKNYLNASYTGPNSAEATPEYGSTQDFINKTVGKGTLANTEAGRKQLVEEQETNKAPGITSLNTALVSLVPETAQKIAATQPQFQALGNYLKGITPDLNAQIASAKATTAATPGIVQNEVFTPQAANFESMKSTITNRVGSELQKQGQYDQAINKLSEFLSSGNYMLSPEQEGLFGLNHAQDVNNVTNKATSVLGEVDPFYQSYWATPNIAKTVVAYATGEKAIPSDENYRVTDATNRLKEYINNHPNDFPTIFLKINPDVKANPGQAISQYFGDTSLSKNAPTEQSVTTDEELARIIALQNLVPGITPFLGPRSPNFNKYVTPNITPYQKVFVPGEHMPIGGDVLGRR